MPIFTAETRRRGERGEDMVDIKSTERALDLLAYLIAVALSLFMLYFLLFLEYGLR